MLASLEKLLDLFGDVISMLATRKTKMRSDVISGDAHLLGRPTLAKSGRPSNKPTPPIIGAKIGDNSWHLKH